MQFYSIYLSISILFWFFFRSFFVFFACAARLVVKLLCVFWLSPSDACTARFKTSEVTEFAFSRAAPGWVTSPPIQREHHSERAQESGSVCVCVEKNQLLFTTLQAARGNSAGTEGGANIHRERERERHETAQASQPNNSRRERACVRGNAAVKQRLSFT